MPMSSWATVMMNSHCQAADSNPHTIVAQMNDSDTIYSHDHIAMDNVSHTTCDGCGDNMNCSVSICNATAMFDGVVIDISDPSHFDYQRMKSFAYPIDPTLPYRPPITFS